MANVGPKLICGNATCGSGATVGQGNYPELWALYTTDDASVSAPLWVDATSKVRAFNVSRGRESELDEIDAGVASLVMDNRTRTFDPSFSSAIKPLNRWWLREQFNGETQDMFKGYADSYDNQWPDVSGSKDAVCVVSCSDEFKVLALGGLSVTDPPRDSYGDVVMFDDPSGYWRFDEGATNFEWQPTVGSNTLTADLNGGSSATYGNSTFSYSIVGDPGGFLYVFTPGVGHSMIWTTGALTAGEAGDVGTLTEFTIEFWFCAEALPASNETLISGPSSGGNPQYSVTYNTTGTISVNARGNGNATNYAVTSSSAITTGTITNGPWYHVVGTITGGNLILYINGAQAGSTAFTPSFGAIASGAFTLLGAPTNGSTIRGFDELAIYRRGLSAARVLAHYEAGASNGFPITQLPGARIGAVLDSITSHAPRSTNTGTRPMQGSYMTGQDPLSELRKARQADAVDAMLFTTKDGTIKFLGDGHRASGSYATVQATFDDDGTDSAYVDLNVDYNESFLANVWNVTRNGGTVQTVSDTTSISKYFARPKSISDVPVTTDSACGTIAAAMLAKYKDPYQRITSLAPKMADPHVAGTVYQRDLGDRIRVFRRPPSGGTIDQTLFIQKIEISGDATKPFWDVRWGVSPL